MSRDLPQLWELRLVQFCPDPQVTILRVNRLSQGRWVVSLGDEGGARVITALTPFGTRPADYWISVRPAPAS